MQIKSFNRAILLIIGVITISIWSILLWDHFHGGVLSHHLLANKDLPKISNWWGAITVFLISNILLNRIKKRIKTTDNQVPVKFINKEIYSFLIALLYAISIAVSFTTGNTQISSLLFLGLPAIALFFPIYRPAYLLGFLIGMMHTFGGVLPILFGFIVSVISYLLYTFIHPLLIKLQKRSMLN